MNESTQILGCFILLLFVMVFFPIYGLDHTTFSHVARDLRRAKQTVVRYLNQHRSQ